MSIIQAQADELASRPIIKERATIYPEKGVGYFLIILLILSSSHAFMAAYNDELIAISSLFVALFVLHFRRGWPPMLLGYLIFFALWLLVIGWQWQFFNINTAIGFFCRMFIAVGVVFLMGKSFFYRYVDVVYILACISLPFYILGLLAPSALELLQSILQIAPNIFIVDQGLYEGWGRVNFGVYTFSMQRLGQNHGFLWEPTAFAAALLFALMSHLWLSGFQWDRKKVVLVVCLLTTVSTTGFIAFSCIIAFVMINQKNAIRIGAIFLLIPCLIMILSMDFITGKIERELARGDDVSQVNTELTQMGNSRLSSFFWDMRDFNEHPILGLGIFEEVRYNGFQKLGSVNGLSDTFARFGAIGAMIFLLSYYFSFQRLAKEEGWRGGWLFFTMLLLLLWSERMTILPLFMAFQYYIYTQPEEDPSEAVLTEADRSEHALNH